MLTSAAIAFHVFTRVDFTAVIVIAFIVVIAFVVVIIVAFVIVFFIVIDATAVFDVLIGTANDRFGTIDAFAVFGMLIGTTRDDASAIFGEYQRTGARFIVAGFCRSRIGIIIGIATSRQTDERQSDKERKTDEFCVHD